jgi:ribulose-phosphate 3-epimerase
MVTLAKSLGSPVVEAHLMTVSPERHLETFAEAGADRIIVHQEATPHLHRVLGRIKQLGILAGVAINPGTPASLLREVIEITDVILVMTVNPGWGGQPFIPKCLEKVREIADIINERGAATLIEVDGGVNDLTIPQCVTAGASLLVTGTALFAAQNVATRFRELQSIARNG